jgi:hypothetical protein
MPNPISVLAQFDLDAAAARKSGVLPLFLDRTDAYLAARRNVARLLTWLDDLHRSVPGDQVTPASVALLANHALRLGILADTLEAIARRRARDRRRRQARRNAVVVESRCAANASEGTSSME